MQKPDSIIFDMDGTLWDAVDTYAQSWNIIFEQKNINRVIERHHLMNMMGWEGKKVVAALLPEYSEDEGMEIYTTVTTLRSDILPKMGGQLYDGVIEGLRQLSARYPLFILSNCAKGHIRLFMDWAGINEYITDEFAYGVNRMPKHHNIALLQQKHHLKNPVYVGDTEGDGQQSRLAGIPFVFVSYGFGKTDDYDVKFDDFTSLTKYFLDL